jgi:hypothetical protein
MPILSNSSSIRIHRFLLFGRNPFKRGAESLVDEMRALARPFWFQRWKKTLKESQAKDFKA